MDELLWLLKSIISEKLEIGEDQVEMKTSFRRDLGADDLDIEELKYALEENFDITIPDENKFETVGDVYKFFKSTEAMYNYTMKNRRSGGTDKLGVATGVANIASGAFSIAAGGVLGTISRAALNGILTTRDASKRKKK